MLHFAVDAIEEKQFHLKTIVGNILVTSSGNITISGGLKLVTNIRNKLALTFNGVDQFLDWTEVIGQCLMDPDQCTHGLTITFSLKFSRLEEDMYVLSNCGDEEDGTGIAMYYRRRRLYFTLTTRSREWTVYLKHSDIDQGQYQQFEVTWSGQAGLEISVDGKHAKRDKRFRKRSVKKPKKCPFYMGRPQDPKKGKFASFELEFWQVVYAAKEIITGLDIIVGRN